MLCGGGIETSNRTILENGTRCPPLERTRTCNPLPCIELQCSNDTCVCFDVETSASWNTTQTTPPHVAWGNCSAYLEPIVQNLNWTDYCDDIQLCYTTCNNNKLSCDQAFVSNLTNSCFTLPGTERAVCRAIVKQWTMDRNNRTVLADFYSLQNASCACLAPPEMDSTMYHVRTGAEPSWVDRITAAWQKIFG